MRRWYRKCILCGLLRSEQGIPSEQCQYHDLIKSALTQFIKEDRRLSVCDVNERSQTHKLAEYIQQALPEYNIDCEYNKNLTKDKELDFTKPDKFEIKFTPYNLVPNSNVFIVEIKKI